MGSVIRSVYGFLSRTVTERWAGSLHAGALVKGLYLQWMLGPRLRKAAGTAFDAGCGEQAQFARLLARRFPAWRFVGMDLKIAAGERRLPNLLLCQGDLSRLPVAGPFDVIWSVDVLEHLEDAEACLRALAERLSPGGWFFLHVPSLRQHHFLRGVDLEYGWLGPPGAGDAHVWEGFEPEQLVAWLQKAGCQVLACRFTFGRPVTVLKEVFMLAEARRIPGVGLTLFPFVVLAAWLERRFGPRSGNGLLLLARKAAV
ncbi:MAG TPA: methyltransferase domain-containing protein [Methylomirabilota bacterium]|nr:methyltransferase domain-containing protein [Methylomirabilota bacterium]